MDYQPAPYQPPQPDLRVVPTSGMATASLVLGIIGIVGGWCAFGLPCILAIACGHLGMSETKTGRKAGRGMAVAGLILGYVCVIPMLLIGLLFIGGAASSQ